MTDVSTSAAWRNRIVGSGEVSPAELIPNPANWRSHPADQQRALTGALGEVGWVSQVIVNRTTGHLVDGHLRVELALARKEPSVPVTYVELSEAEERIVLATLDPLAAMATAETEALAGLLEGLDVGDGALRELMAELAKRNGVDTIRAGLVDPDDVPDVPAKLYVKHGELYALGDHRLLCGDSTNADDVSQVSEGRTAAILWTDPPYGVEYQTKLSRHEAVARHRRRDGLEVRNDAPDGIPALLGSMLRHAPLAGGGSFYMASPSSADVMPAFYAALAAASMPVRQQLIWVKDVFVLGRQSYHYRHEPILYGWRDGAAHAFYGGRSQDTVWEIPRPRRSEQHPTMKPVELVTRALENSSRPGDLAYEPFAGSGTTLIAAEQTGRLCAAIEIEPRYVQVVIERWEAFTGRKAELLHG